MAEDVLGRHFAVTFIFFVVRTQQRNLSVSAIKMVVVALNVNATYVSAIVSHGQP